jgi:hypothetical protein
MTLGVVCFVCGLAAGWLPIKDYIETRFVSHVPLALLAAALEILAALFYGIALVLDAIVRLHIETLEAIDSMRSELQGSGRDAARNRGGPGWRRRNPRGEDA